VRAKRSVAAGLLAGALVLGHVLFLPPCDELFGPWELQAEDLFFRVRAATGWGLPDRAPELVYVQISDATAGAIGTRSIDREQFARVVRILGAVGARLQVHDAAFFARSRESDRRMGAAVKQAGNVVVGRIGALGRDAEGDDAAFWDVEVVGDSSGLLFVTPLPGAEPVIAAARGQGLLNVQRDRDGVVRRSPLIARGPRGHVPSLALAAACVALQVPPDRVLLEPGRALTLRGAKNGRDIVIPIDNAGRVRIDFREGWRDLRGVTYAFERIHAVGEDPVELELLARDLRGRIVLVADLTTAAGDALPTPLDRNDAGPIIHGQLLQSILNGRFLREMGWTSALALELVLLGALLFLARRRVFLLAGGGVVAAAVYLATVLLLFLHGGIVAPIVGPLLAWGFGMLGLVGYRFLLEQRRRAVIQASFEAYFPRRLVRRLAEEPDRIAVGGKRRELTILFSDIRGFTSRSTEIEPDALQALLNRYFEAMTGEVFKQGGTVDKFIGDGLMVFFGDPEEQPDHPARAVRSAVGMLARLAELNTELAGEGIEPIQIRIGIHTGPVIVGNMGSPRRLAYTVLGSAVNLAARLEGLAPVDGILISSDTAAKIDSEFELAEHPPVEAKGFADPIAVFRVRTVPE